MTLPWRKWFKSASHQQVIDRRRKVGRQAISLWLEALEERVVPDSGGSAGILSVGNLVFHGGSVMSSVQVEPIFLKDSGTGQQVSAAMQTQFVNYFTDVTTGTYIPNLLNEYSIPGFTIGNGSVGAVDNNVAVTPMLTNYLGSYRAVDDTQLPPLIDQEIVAGRTAAPTANTLYFIFTPPGDAETAGGLDSITGFGGYHTGYFNLAGTLIPYAVIPYQNPPNSFTFNPFASMTFTSSHELAESITDSNSGWTDNVYTADDAEVGDHAESDEYTMDGYQVQYEWSNALKSPAHALGTGAHDLFINQVSPPAVNTFVSGPVATFTTADTSLTAADFSSFVGTVVGGAFGPGWSSTISGGNGHFVVNAQPPGPLANGTVGTPFALGGEGFYLNVSDNVNNSFSSRLVPFTVKPAAPFSYIADSTSGVNNFVLKEVGTDFQLSNNGLVVFTQPIKQTTTINIGADPTQPGNAAANVDDSLTIDYSGGIFNNSVTFDGGPGSGAHSISFTSGVFGSESYTPASATAGMIVLGSQSITFTNASTVVDLATAASFTFNGRLSADQINVIDGPTVNGAQTTEVNSGNGTFAKVDFANKNTVTLQGLTGQDTFTLNNLSPAVGLKTLNVDSGATAGVVFNVQITPAGVATNVVGGGNGVKINVGNVNGTQSILGALTLSNTSGAKNAITINDVPDLISRTVTVGSGTIQGISPVAINFQVGGTQSLTVNGGSAGNFFTVQSTGVATTINGGTGSDTFNVYPQATATNLTVNGQAPFTAPGDVLVYNGPGTLPGALGSSSGTITQTGQGSIIYKSIETLNLGASLSLSTLTITPGVILLGTTATVTLKTVDAVGTQETGGGLTVGFVLGSGAGNDSIGPVTDNHDGTYTATFTGLTVSTTTITATIGTPTIPQPVSSAPANVTVNLGNFSLTQSTVTINPSSIQSGGTATVTLNGRDINGNPGPSGFPVVFNLGSGGATGTFSATTDNHDGSYSAIFTGVLIGTNTINAYVGGPIIASAPPTITVTSGPVDLTQSVVSINPAAIIVGATSTVVLTAKDAAGNQEQTGGLTVAFALGSGAGNGTFGPVADNGNGTYKATFTATGSGTNTVTATIGGLQVTSAAPTVTVQQAPAITSVANATFIEGTAGTFTVATTGVPAPTVTESGTLPTGLLFDSTTGSFSGTPATGTNGTYNVTLTAANGVGSNATQAFTLLVQAAPVFTSPATTSFLVGSAGTFTVSATGRPTPTLSLSGSLPAGLSFDPTTGILSGSPAAGTAGIVPLTFSASNGVSGVANQPFTLVIDAAPTFLSAPGTTFTVNNPGTFTVATNAFPAATLSESGTLPRGVTFNAVTGVLSGTPANGTSGLYLLTFTATNGIGVDAVQNFTLTVNATPVLLGGKLVHFTASVAGLYKIPVSGVPAPTFSEVGALPAGITLDPVNGVFSGTPARASAGNYAVTITATNSGGSATQQLTLIVAPATGPQPAAYDKLGAYRSSDGSWSEDSDGTAGFNAATDQTFMHFSPSGVTGVAGDWLGVGRDTIGDFSNGVWHLDLNGNGILDPGETFHFGQAGDRPIVGDWDGNGRSELGVFRTATDGVSGEFILDFANHKALDASNQAFNFGLTTDLPVIGDWNGDGKSKVGVVRDAAAYGAPGAALFTLDTINYHRFDARSQIFVFGRITDGIVIGDWNGDGVSKVGVYRDGSAGYNAPGVALFSLDTNNNHHFETGVDPVFLYGYTTDQFVAGNWETTPPVLPAELAAGGQGPGGAPSLTTAQLAPVLQQAIADWTAHGASAAQLASVQVRIGYLDGALVGWTAGNVVTLDADAAGWGWSTDLSTPQAGKMDLLTVVEHELGHELGLNDVDASSHPGDLMASTLPTGTRRSIK